MVIGWICRQSRVFNRLADRKMIKALIAIVAEAQNLVDRVIKKAADARTPEAVCFCLQVQHLADHPALPKHPAVEPRSKAVQSPLKLTEHAQAEAAVRGDGLATRQSR